MLLPTSKTSHLFEVCMNFVLVSQGSSYLPEVCHTHRSDAVLSSSRDSAGVKFFSVCQWLSEPATAPLPDDG
jgi:hypothetical protein